MKAITVTQTLKNLNSKLFEDYNLGQIKTFNSIPKVFFRINGGGKRTDAYNTLGTLEHQEDGFYSVVIPAYNTNTQYLSNLHFTGTDFTYDVNNYTGQELTDKANIESFELAGTVESVRADDGKEETKFIFKRLRKLFNSGAITLNQFNQAQDLLFDALLPCSYGLWDVTKTRLDNLTNPANATLLAILNEIRARITYYINNDNRQGEII